MFVISVNPVAFTIGSFSISWYGIMVALAVIALLAMTLRETKRLCISQDIIYSLFLWGIIGGFIGARLVVIQWDHYIAHPEDIFNFIGFPAFSLYGAIIGALLAVWLYMRVRRTPFSSLAGVGDAVAVGAPLAQAIGRIGCTINGCCHGNPSPFSFFPAAVIYTPRNAIPPQLWGVPLYPTQIYFLIWNLVVFAIIWRFRGKLKPQGSLFFLYLCLYAAGDFGLRFLRYVDAPFLFGLQQGQIISLAILIIAAPWLTIRMRKFQQKTLVTESTVRIDQLGQNRKD